MYMHARRIASACGRKVRAIYASFSYSTVDYVIQENAWSSSSSTSQRMKQATFKVHVFIGDVSKKRERSLGHRLSA